MARYIEGRDRHQSFLLPECLDDYVCDDNPIRVIEAFVDELDFGGCDSAWKKGSDAVLVMIIGLLR